MFREKGRTRCCHHCRIKIIVIRDGKSPIVGMFQFSLVSPCVHPAPPGLSCWRLGGAKARPRRPRGAGGPSALPDRSWAAGKVALRAALGWPSGDRQELGQSRGKNGEAGRCRWQRRNGAAGRQHSGLSHLADS